MATVKELRNIPTTGKIPPATKKSITRENLQIVKTCTTADELRKVLNTANKRTLHQLAFEFPGFSYLSINGSTPVKSYYVNFIVNALFPEEQQGANKEEAPAAVDVDTQEVETERKTSTSAKLKAWQAQKVISDNYKIGCFEFFSEILNLCTVREIEKIKDEEEIFTRFALGAKYSKKELIEEVADVLESRIKLVREFKDYEFSRLDLYCPPILGAWIKRRGPKPTQPEPQPKEEAQEQEQPQTTTNIASEIPTLETICAAKSAERHERNKAKIADCKTRAEIEILLKTADYETLEALYGYYCPSIVVGEKLTADEMIRHILNSYQITKQLEKTQEQSPAVIDVEAHEVPEQPAPVETSAIKKFQTGQIIRTTIEQTTPPTILTFRVMERNGENITVRELYENGSMGHDITRKISTTQRDRNCEFFYYVDNPYCAVCITAHDIIADPKPEQIQPAQNEQQQEKPREFPNVNAPEEFPESVYGLPTHAIEAEKWEPKDPEIKKFHVGQVLRINYIDKKEFALVVDRNEKNIYLKFFQDNGELYTRCAFPHKIFITIFTNGEKYECAANINDHFTGGHFYCTANATDEERATLKIPAITHEETKAPALPARIEEKPQAPETVKPTTKPHPQKIIFEVGKSYTAKDYKDPNNTLTFEVLERHTEGKGRNKFPVLTVHLTGTGKNADIDSTRTVRLISIDNNVECTKSGGNLPCYDGKDYYDKKVRTIYGELWQYMWFADTPAPVKETPAPTEQPAPTATKKPANKFALTLEGVNACETEQELADYLMDAKKQDILSLAPIFRIGLTAPVMKNSCRTQKAAAKYFARQIILRREHAAKQAQSKDTQAPEAPKTHAKPITSTDKNGQICLTFDFEDEAADERSAA